MNYLLLKEINFSTLLYVLIIVSVIAVIFAILIVLVSKLCFVKEDEKAKSILEHLSGANCGGCGYAGCSDYAKALSEGKASINECSSTSNENKQIIANILNIEFCAQQEQIAVVKCSGGNFSKNKFNYVGNDDCLVKNTFLGGNKLCTNACLGGGSCAKACPHNGIKVNNELAKTNSSICEGCGVCIKTCPKRIIEYVPKSAKIYVACSSNCRGKEVLNSCEKGCIGCGLCAKNCPENAITMVNNLPVIDYKKCTSCRTCLQKCPRNCIKEV